ncbi:MAG: hypothetical protein Q9169_002510 [Polycauliona sp. 2 TL-2023]
MFIWFIRFLTCHSIRVYKPVHPYPSSHRLGNPNTLHNSTSYPPHYICLSDPMPPAAAPTKPLAVHPMMELRDFTGFCGFMSILSSMHYCLGPSTSYGNIYLALAFIPLGLFFDFMDGKVARWRKKSSLMGQELDSLADLVCLGDFDRPEHVFFSDKEEKGIHSPASAAFALGLRTPLDTLLLSFFVLCGLTRLARFNVTVSTLPKDATGKSKYFEGTPIPTSLCMVAAMAWAVNQGHVIGGQNGVLGGLMGDEQSWWGGVHPIVGVFVGWGCAMVSRTIHIPKP